MTSSPSTLSRAERKKLEMRQEILDAAFACFSEQGYHATGVADIAGRIGIGHGTFYRYFKSKRDIIEHVIDDVTEQIFQAIGAENAAGLADDIEQYRQQSVRIGAALADLFRDNPQLPLLLLEAGSVDNELRERVFGMLATSDQLTEAYLRHGVEKGYLRADLDTEYTARAVTGMILATGLHASRGGEVQDSERFSAAVIALMYGGIGS
ncbi:TetR family transcriptional regulator [Mycobacteroides chelonae]|uniref:TetR/AcrR family transcriptional regulator n=1 Tax=Mycobacteroides chelonae TaxID=1774 RepID=UPI0007A0F403|nr:TetR/AcrR family transcriptional regulator [Mycobacteroides chelonae]AMW19164.1 TetR family transcriptional regulator [Mycobacterium sp. QIA-37]PKQ59776.1 TetR family transcriptional regulator [Mycobacterium sp. MHSD3]SKO11734.1 Putative transcriptional regulator, TetR family [Mycobacteroides abscessus subsp. bolletii]AYM41476.1 TetR/AcrR family transcriptional regulator [[Mycobacterium] chelonae subsp. gwanakae]MBF9520726.1 TetR/AcrR family transcriptional regulator [Mycobacteroides chelon